MSVVVVGVNQRSIPIDAFEKLTIGQDRMVKLVDDLMSSVDISEAVVLSTCNRTEIYVKVERFHPAYSDVQQSLSRHSGLDRNEFADHLYVHADEDAARHLFSVACGIDSAVLGETEILGQVRAALEAAKSAGVAGLELNDLFTAAGTAGRKVRSSTAIGRNITSVSRAAVAMATDRLGTLDGRSICVLGAGEMSEGMTVALRDAGTRRIVICNRSIDRATLLAERVGGDVVPLDALSNTISGIDVLLTGTGANDLMVSHETLERVMAQRPNRPLLIVDIAVPRDVDPAAADIDNVTLLDMDDLTAFAEIGRAERRGEISAVRTLIDEEVVRFCNSAASRKVEPMVKAFRSTVESVRQGELARLDATVDAETLAHVDAATKAVLNKLLHHPMAQLRGNAGTAKGDRLANALVELFDLDLDQ